jgi:hypothetical protein
VGRGTGANDFARLAAADLEDQAGEEIHARIEESGIHPALGNGRARPK